MTSKEPSTKEIVRRLKKTYPKKDWTKVFGKSNLHNLWTKSLPVLIGGMIIWFFSTLFYGGYLGVPPLNLDLSGKILLLIIYFGLWLFSFFLALTKNNLFAMITFFITSWVTGICQYPILVWVKELLGLDIARNLFFMASLFGILSTLAVFIMGYSLKGKIGGRYLISLSIFGLILVITEPILIFIFGFDEVIFITSIGVLAYVFLTILIDGSRLQEKMENDEWMMITLRIFLDLIIVIIRVFIIFAKNKSTK
jgi:hypothetical protein